VLLATLQEFCGVLGGGGREGGGGGGGRGGGNDHVVQRHPA
jgi:hypothetical protein